MRSNYIDELVYYEVDGTGYYPLQGVNYNIEAVTNEAGAVVEWYQISPFGQVKMYSGNGTPIDQSYVSNRHFFQGRDYDSDLEMFYFRNRWYSPTMARFISRDPMRYRAGDINLYRFVGNNPYGGLDPLGLAECCLESFRVDLTEVDPTDIHISFETRAIFKDDMESSNGCGNCNSLCCQFKQFVRGYMEVNGNSSVAYTGSGRPLHADEFRDDGYGYRNSAFRNPNLYFMNDRYMWIDEEKMTRLGYYASDRPGLHPEERPVNGWLYDYDIEFLSVIIDKCNSNKVLASKNFGFSYFGYYGKEGANLSVWGF